MNFEMETSDRMIEAIKIVSDKVAFIEVKDSKRETLSYGSGIVVSDGAVLTCYHVVVDKQPNHILSVTLNEVSYDGEIDDVHKRYDLAIIKIPKKGLLPVKFGRTRLLKPGQHVISMGCPFMLPKSSTEGIISCKPHDFKDAGDIIYLQHSAATEFGSSGGPLFDLDGNVIGINLYILNIGFSFSIPCEYAMEFIRRAEEKKKHNIVSEFCLFPRYTGLCIVKVPLALIEEKRQRGKIPKLVKNILEVSRVVENSPAEKSGFSVGDVITKVNNKTVNTVHEFINSMNDDDDVIEVYRDSKLLSLILHREEKEETTYKK